MKDKVEAGEPAIGFSIDCKLNDRRAMVMQSYLPIDASKEQINDLLDRMMAAAGRQELAFRLKDMRLILEKQEAELPMHEKDLAKFEEDAVREHQKKGRRSEFEWSGQLKANRENKLTNVAMARVNIERTKKAIAEAEAEIAKG